MRLLIEVIALLVIGTLVVSVGLVVLGPNPLKLGQGELRCEGAGAVIINVDGKDYAVNGLAGPSYPPIQTIWNSASYPETNVDRLIIRGLTLCQW